MTPRPPAAGYASASDPETLDEQRHAVTEYVRAEGCALAQIVTDRFDDQQTLPIDAAPAGNGQGDSE